MALKEVVQYQTKEGKVPFRDWLLSLKDITMRARIRARLDRLRLGNFGDVRSVGQGVFEMRFHFGPGYRAYYGQQGDVIVVLLCGGDKAGQADDIALARDYWHDYQRRTGEAK